MALPLPPFLPAMVVQQPGGQHATGVTAVHADKLGRYAKRLKYSVDGEGRGGRRIRGDPCRRWRLQTCGLLQDDHRRCLILPPCVTHADQLHPTVGVDDIVRAQGLALKAKLAVVGGPWPWAVR